jgi:hypothetical protein
MPRNSSTGAYTFPSNSFNPAVDGQTLSSSDWNTLKADIEAAMSYTYGTFTPTLKFGGGNSGMTGTFTGEYEQVGNRVFYSIGIVLTAKGSSTGSAVVGGLPVTAAATNDKCFVTPELVTLNTAGGYLGLRGSHVGTDITLREWGSAVSTSTIDEARFQNTSTIFITGNYRV